MKALRKVRNNPHHHLTNLVRGNVLLSSFVKSVLDKKDNAALYFDHQHYVIHQGG